MLLLHESRPRSFWTIKVPIRDASNNIIGLSGISSELDNIYANTSDAIRHNRLLNTILSNVDAYIYVKGADGTYLYANQQISSLYGQNNDDVIGLNDIDIHGPEVAERLMKLGVDESFAPGARLEECEDDGSEAFDRIWAALQEKDGPIWET